MRYRYRWYAEATVCLAWLHDFPKLKSIDPDDLPHAFSGSEWFSRGWTLQELLAPKRVVFYFENWEPIGYKATNQSTRLGHRIYAVGRPLNQWISQATGIPENVLWDTSQAENLSFEERQSWMKGRKTTRIEDMAVRQDKALISLFVTDDAYAVLSAWPVWCFPQPNLWRTGRSLREAARGR